MKILIILVILNIFSLKEAYPLSNYEIRERCQKLKRKKACIRDLEFKRLNLQKGNKIQIPVIPYKK